MYRNLVFLLCFLSGSVTAHEWTPTYPELEYSHVQGVLRTEMLIFNARKDVQFYEISVWDAEWNKISFATEMKIIPIDYLERKNVTIYTKEKDKDRVTYICSESKLRSDGESKSSVSSKVCSKIKR